MSKYFPPNDLPRGSIYDYYFEYTKPEGEFRNWSNIMPEFTYSKELNYF